jgi:hypothetical protein
MPRPLPPGGQRRRNVPLRLSAQEEAPVREIADADYGGELSAAIRALLAEAIAARQMAADEGMGGQELQVGAEQHDDHDIHGLVVEVWPDGSQTIDDDCDCSPDCAQCRAEGVVRPEPTPALDIPPTGYVDLDARYRTGTEASNRLVAETRYRSQVQGGAAGGGT